MRLQSILEKRKSEYLNKWFESVVDTYPADTSKFLKRQKDPFANPVGSTTLASLQSLFDQLLKTEMDDAAIDEALDPIIRIRAVQTIFHPSQAVGFPYVLKRLVRESLKKEMKERAFIDDLMAFELRVDEVVLRGFNIYMKCRETVLNLKIDVEKNRVHRAFTRAGLIKERPDETPDPE